jgi:hypothetical protein
METRSLCGMRGAVQEGDYSNYILSFLFLRINGKVKDITTGWHSSIRLYLYTKTIPGKTERLLRRGSSFRFLSSDRIKST